MSNKKKSIVFSSLEEQAEDYRKFCANTDFKTGLKYLNELIKTAFPDAFDENGKPKAVIKKITFTEKEIRNAF